MSGEEERRGLILDAAGRSFGRYGYRKTTVGDIVREAGVARATVYKYFATKDDMFRAVIDREMEDIVRAVRTAVEKESTTRERLRAAVVTQSATIREKVNVYRLTIQALSDVIGRTHAETGHMAEEAIRTYSWILEEGVRKNEIVVDDIETTAWSILLAFKGVFMTTITGEFEELLPAASERLLELVWGGLKCSEGTA